MLCDGQSMGTVASMAIYQGPEYEALYLYLWDNYPDAICTVLAGRGASAQEDWDADKAMTVIDCRGRVLAGSDDMGGTDANRLVGAIPGSFNGNVLGVGGGFEGIELQVDMIPPHTHNISAGSSFDQNGGTTSQAVPQNSQTDGGMTDAGDASSHYNVQPTIIVNTFIKL